MSIKAEKRKLEDEVENAMTRPPPPLPPTQAFYPPPGHMAMQWVPGPWANAGAVPGQVHNNRIPNQYFPRGRGHRMYQGQGRGMRMYPHQNFNNYNYNQNVWSTPPPPPPPYIDVASPTPVMQVGDNFLGQMPGAPWLPNTNVPPPPLPQPQVHNMYNGNHRYNMNQNHAQENGKKKKKNKGNQPQPAANSRPWNREDAIKALTLENECQKTSAEQALVIRFPDPDLSKEIVRKFHPAIESVHFQAPSGARFCFAQLMEGANVDKVISDIEKIKFGTGKLKAERKLLKTDDLATPEAIDPYTLYVGNLPTNITSAQVKEKFPSAHRVDIGYAAKMKFTRYSFIRFLTVESAMEAYKSALNMQIAGRSIILRFRRHKGPVGPPGENQTERLKSLPVATKVKEEKDPADEDEEDVDDVENDDDDDDDYDEDDDDDEDEDEDEGGDNEEDEEEPGERKVVEEDDEEDEDDDEEEVDEDDDDEDEPVPKQEREETDDEEDKDDKFQDMFDKLKNNLTNTNTWQKK